ncbi:hypothetical protein [Lysinibacillus piscis]|uniref:Uncharacterized protein n=1 Tax=Lysinibacillus piscis TaxID=2518931 RepID=A0ABQ5NLW0_9BACI|nr:hypothetical protein [Lysinibacillus sp. KH24]GLC89092.1 hypothetical protein LYSBPC_22190 [Lysinibacillus sp. KH24]
MIFKRLLDKQQSSPPMEAPSTNVEPIANTAQLFIQAIQAATHYPDDLIVKSLSPNLTLLHSNHLIKILPNL